MVDQESSSTEELPLRFGLLVSKDDPPDIDGRQRIAEYVERAVIAKEAGVDTIAVGHRYSYGPAVADDRGSPLESSRFQPLMVLGHIAAHLGDSVNYAPLVLVSTSLNPVQLAEDVVTLDAMTGGRLRVGLGLGWMPSEFEAFGIQRRTRAGRFEELIKCYRALLTEDRVDFHGAHFDFTDARMIARSVQKPAPPLWIGASSEPAIRRAARLGDTWTVSAHFSVEELVAHRKFYLDELALLGKPVPAERPITRVLYLAEDRESAIAEARPALADWYRRRGDWGWFLTEGKEFTDNVIADGRWILGNPQDCIEQIRSLQERLDVNHIVFNLSPGVGVSHEQRLRTIKLFGDEVLPAFRGAVTVQAD